MTHPLIKARKALRTHLVSGHSYSAVPTQDLLLVLDHLGHLDTTATRTINGWSVEMEGVSYFYSDFDGDAERAEHSRPGNLDHWAWTAIAKAKEDEAAKATEATSPATVGRLVRIGGSILLDPAHIIGVRPAAGSCPGSSVIERTPSYPDIVIPVEAEDVIAALAALGKPNA